MAENTNFELTKPVAVNKKLKNNLTSELKDLKKMLSAEKSAVATYIRVLNKFPDNIYQNDLKGILADHDKASLFWMTQLRAKEVHFDEFSGHWKKVDESFTHTKKLKADSVTLKSLKKGEEHELIEYEGILRNNNVNFQAHAFIKNICLDQQRKHIAILENLVAQLN